MSHVDNTWLAYAFEREAEPEQIEAGLRRVERHYQELCAQPLVSSASVDRSIGMALLQRPDERLRWPLWSEGSGVSVAATNAPTGCERLLGDADASPVVLGRALRSDPDRLVDLNPPFVLGVHDTRARTLTIVNDFLAAARLFELRTEGGRLWSNRLGALSLFAGIAPEADEEAWAMLAATGWFLGDHTPMRGARKVRPGSATIARATPQGALVESRQTAAVNSLVAPRRSRLRRSAAAAAEQAVDLARSVDRLWAVPAIVNLSGGRDSRVSAAAAIVAGLDAEYRTMDVEPGEVEAVRRLIAASPAPMAHAIQAAERVPEDDLEGRIRDKHLIHDGISNPISAIRGPTRLPRKGFSRPLITGHGGELGHGFYYTRSSLRKLRRRGFEGLVGRLERTGRQKHSAAHDHAYEAFVAEVRRTLAEGQAHGLEGPTLLDYFYLAQRLPFRAGLGSRNDRYSPCATPAFVRAAFDLTSTRRVRADLHREIIRRLVPEWRRVPFFHGAGGRLPKLNRDRVWDKPRHSEQLEEMLARRSVWGELFVPERVDEIWADVKRGEGHSHYEAILLRIAWRVGYEDHLRLLADRVAVEAATL